ncbi:MAG: hypothetical protein WDN24_17675 [Sphingomonas sp.]
MNDLNPATSRITVPGAIDSPVRDRVSPEEWTARLELAALYRLCAHFGSPTRSTPMSRCACRGRARRS